MVIRTAGAATRPERLAVTAVLIAAASAILWAVIRRGRLAVTAVLLGIAAALLWGILAAQMWVQVPERALYLVNPAAITTSVIAAICWIASGSRQREASHSLVLDTLWNVTRPASGRRTGPLQRVQ